MGAGTARRNPDSLCLDLLQLERRITIPSLEGAISRALAGSQVVKPRHVVSSSLNLMAPHLFLGLKGVGLLVLDEAEEHVPWPHSCRRVKGLTQTAVRTRFYLHAPAR